MFIYHYFKFVTWVTNISLAKQKRKRKNKITSLVDVARAAQAHKFF